MHYTKHYHIYTSDIQMKAVVVLVHYYQIEGASMELPHEIG